MKRKSSQQTSNKKSGSIKSMEELLAKTNYEIHGLRAAQIIPGRVTEKRNKMVLIDIGAKSVGVVVGKEFEEVKNFVETLSVGDEVLVYVRQPEDEKGQIILSLRKAANDWRWQFFQEKLETGEAVEVRCLGVNKGGLIARIREVQGFIPSSQLSRKYQGKLEQLQNRLLKVKVIEVEAASSRLIFSEKAIGEARILAEKRKVLETIKKGEILEGEVVGIKPFGMFVQVKKKRRHKVGSGKKGSRKSTEVIFEGLVHISEISWEKVERIEDYFKVGDKVKAMVLEIDEESGRLNLSVKRLTVDPWEEIEKEFPPGKRFKGKVSRLAPFGAFVKIKPGAEALLHISKIPADYPIKPEDTVEVEVETVESEARRMSLSLVLKKKPVGYK